MIGNREEAQFILDWYRVNVHSYRDAFRQPEGWDRLGSGCYRIAWLAPSGVVYKVQYQAQPGWQSNASEAAVLRKYWLTRMPKGCRLPRYQFFDFGGDDVIAMERFTKFLNEYGKYDPKYDYWERQGALSRVLRDVHDSHGGNFAVDEETDTLVPTDLAG